MLEIAIKKSDNQVWHKKDKRQLGAEIKEIKGNKRGEERKKKRHLSLHTTR